MLQQESYFSECGLHKKNLGNLCIKAVNAKEWNTLLLDEGEAYE